MATSSLLGRSSLEVGPANLYIKPRWNKNNTETDWADDSDYINLGKTESSTLRMLLDKTDLASSQGGTVAEDQAVTGFGFEIETSLGQATLERLERIQQGLRVEYDSQGNVVQYMYVDPMGERNSDKKNQLWVKVVGINGGAESIDPLDTIYSLMAPSADSTELGFDAGSQRFYPITFKSLENDSTYYGVDFVDDDGRTRPARFWSGEVV